MASLINPERPGKPNPPKKYHQKKTKKTFVVKNWMLYTGYYVILILIPIIMIALGAFLGWESIAGVGAIILFFGVLNLANSLSLYIGMTSTLGISTRKINISGSIILTL